MMQRRDALKVLAAAPAIFAAGTLTRAGTTGKVRVTLVRWPYT